LTDLNKIDKKLHVLLTRQAIFFVDYNLTYNIYFVQFKMARLTIFALVIISCLFVARAIELKTIFEG